MHLYPATPSMQVPWLRQGLEAHSLMLVWQFGPATTKKIKLYDAALHLASPRRRPQTQTLTGEAHAAAADVSAGHVLAGASVHARVGFAFVVVDVAVFAAPAGVTQTVIPEKNQSVKRQGPSSAHRSGFHASSPVDLVLAVAVDAGVAEALVDLGEAGGVVVTVRTRADEAVDAVDAGAAVVAGVAGALVDVDVTHGAWRKERRV